jgi:pyruvate formate lyase activating enzyme
MTSALQLGARRSGGVPEPHRHAPVGRSPGDRAGSSATASMYAWDLVTGDYGPGTRLVLFTAGCPLRCVYCDAPQTWSEHTGRTVRADEVMAHARRYAPLFEVTGGGVTLSGGEPLLHSDFTAAVLRECRALGVHTALDTAGTLGARVDDETLCDVDLTLLDLKSYDADTFHRTTNGEVAPVLRFARRLARLDRPMRVRFVLVPGLTDEPANLEALADFVAGLRTVERVDVVPFHRRGQAGWNALGLRFPLADRPGPTREALAAARATFSSRGLVVA